MYVLNALHFLFDLDSESDLSRDDLVKLVVEKEQLLVKKQEELEQMKDKVLRSLAEMENVKDRTRRESENTKKFAIQVCVFVPVTCLMRTNASCLFFRRTNYLICDAELC